MANQINGTQLFKKGNLTVHQTDCNNYIISNGDAIVVVDEMPQLEAVSLLQLLVADVTVQDFYKSNKQAITPSLYEMEKFNNDYIQMSQHHEAQLLGYAIGY